LAPGVGEADGLALGSVVGLTTIGVGEGAGLGLGLALGLGDGEALGEGIAVGLTTCVGVELGATVGGTGVEVGMTTCVGTTVGGTGVGLTVTGEGDGLGAVLGATVGVGVVADTDEIPDMITTIMAITRPVIRLKIRDRELLDIPTSLDLDFNERRRIKRCFDELNGPTFHLPV
jgi:hypothetical protein